MKKVSMLCFFLLLIPAFVMAELPIGKVPPLVTIEGKDGGRLDGTAWSSSELRGVVSYVFYVDPQEADTNDKATDALGALNNPTGSTKSYVVINKEAAWYPNSMIDKKIAEKQKEYPDTIYVYDNDKILEKKWNLETDSFDVLIFGKDGKVVFSKDGTLSDDEIAKMIAVIKENVAK